MGIEFGKGNRKNRQKIDEAMALIKAWVEPDELRYNEKTGCLSFTIRRGKYKNHYVNIFNIYSISITSDMLVVYTSSGSSVFIHPGGMVDVSVS